MGLLDDAYTKAKHIAGLLSDYYQTGAQLYFPNEGDVKARPELAKGLLQFIPGPGDAISGYDAVQSARQGNYGEASLNGIGLLPFVPAMGGMIKDYKNIAKEMGVRGNASPVKNYESTMDYVNALRGDSATFRKSNSGATVYIGGPGIGYQAIPSNSFIGGKPPSSLGEYADSLERNADSAYLDNLRTFITEKQRKADIADRSRTIKNERGLLSDFYKRNSDAIDNFHKSPELRFQPITSADFFQPQGKFLYQSPSYYGKPGSHYRLIMIDGRPAYARMADHWGEFSARSKEDLETWNNYNWELPSAEIGKRTPGAVFLDDLK